MIRNRDTWRIAEHVDTYGDQTLVRDALGVHLWHTADIQPIEPVRLDRALMRLRESHPDTYATFLATMLGDDR